MTTDQQVRLFMSWIKRGVPLGVAAAKAGMSEPTARKYREAGKLPSQVKTKHSWCTRPDPFTEVWPEIERWLEQDGALQAKAVFEELQRRYPRRFPPGQLRTLQRRFRQWRATAGPPREVFFTQVHRPGEQCQSDFTDMHSLGVRIEGEVFAHLCYHFVLTYSNWEDITVVHSESFEALSAGLQGALWRLGAVPREHRTDNLSAATHELRKSRGRGFTERYRALLEHYRMKASKNFPGNAHENGDVESAHGHFKQAIDQRLRLRGSRDFRSLEDYTEFLRTAVNERNAARATKLAEERAVMRPLPVRPLDACRELRVRVSRASTIRVVGKTYSVPARLIGHWLSVRLQATSLELEFQGQVIARLERLHGQGTYRIDYRHIIHSLVRKPGAFRRYAFQEALFPTLTFRRCYDALVARSTGWPDLEYVRLLHLAATTNESEVEASIATLLNEGVVPEYELVKTHLLPPALPRYPQVRLSAPDLRAYDALLEGQEVHS
jgi:hypothetical protein